MSKECSTPPMSAGRWRNTPPTSSVDRRRRDVRLTPEPRMKAIAYDKYGSFDVLALRDIDKPAVKDGEVLVRVHAAGLQIGDCFGVRGAPFFVRMYTGLLKPKYGVPGYDFAGQVEAVGGGAK